MIDRQRDSISWDVIGWIEAIGCSFADSSCVRARMLGTTVFQPRILGAQFPQTNNDRSMWLAEKLFWRQSSLRPTNDVAPSRKIAQMPHIL